MRLSTFFLNHPIAFDKIPNFFSRSFGKKAFICSPTYSCFFPLKCIVWERKTFFFPFKNWGDVFIHVTLSPNGNNLSMENNTGVFRARLGKQPACFDLLSSLGWSCVPILLIGTFSDGSLLSHLRTGGMKRKKIKLSVMHTIWRAFRYNPVIGVALKFCWFVVGKTESQYVLVNFK